MRTASTCVAAALVLGLAVGTTVLVDAKVRVWTQMDDAFTFRGLRTWTWHPDGAGDVKMALTPHDDPAAVHARVDPVIKGAVGRELAGRGLTSVAAGETPDLHVRYYVLIGANVDRQTIGQNAKADYQWQIPAFVRSTQALRVIEQGSLVLDVSGAASRTLVWRGVAQAEIHRERPPAGREARLRAAIGDLIKRFPKT